MAGQKRALEYVDILRVDRDAWLAQLRRPRRTPLIVVICTVHPGETTNAMGTLRRLMGWDRNVNADSAWPPAKSPRSRVCLINGSDGILSPIIH